MILTFDIFKPHVHRLEQGVTEDLTEIPDAVMADQIHGDTILELKEKPLEKPHCDAFITRRKGLPLMVKIADCQGVLIYDPSNEVIAAVHSGWRGSTLNIIGKTIQKLKRDYGSDPSELLAAVGPSLGPCCAEFSDPYNELPAFAHRFIKPNKHVDFWALTLAQLKEEGLEENQVELAGKCTKCQPGFYSHRNGDSQRLGVFVKLR